MQICDRPSQTESSCASTCVRKTPRQTKCESLIENLQTIHSVAYEHTHTHTHSLLYLLNLAYVLKRYSTSIGSGLFQNVLPLIG